MNWPVFKLNEKQFTFHLQYKYSGTFANREYEELFYPKKSENVRPHHSQSSRDNANPSSDTSSVASCKEVPPLGDVRLCSVITLNETLGKHSKQWLWLNFQSEL